MGAARSAASLGRHLGGVAGQAVLIAAIVGLIALLLAPVYGPARTITGSDKAAAARAVDSIWINELAGTSTARAAGLGYGDKFTAGYTSRIAEPWGYAACWANETTVLGTPAQGTYSPGDVIWSEYRSLWDGGPVPAAFDLTDPLQGLWVGGGADCALNLMKIQGSRRTVLASMGFTVQP